MVTQQAGMATRRKNVVVIGAGVTGLTTAILLANDPTLAITIIAKHVPGDYSPEYASPWAGANYLPQCESGSRDQAFERDTWPDLRRLATIAPETAIHFQQTVAYKRDETASETKQSWRSVHKENASWWKDLFRDFTILEDKKQLPDGYEYASSFTSVCINTAIYLPWLASQCLRKGCKIRRGTVGHISMAALMHSSGGKADVVVNCTGLGALRLGGVEDANMYPIRGQVALVRNSPGMMVDTSSTRDGPEEVTYIMDRAGGGGCVIGGTYQPHNWTTEPDMNEASRMLKRATELCPSLTDGRGVEELDIVRHAVGLRPARIGGIRLEKESIQGQWVVHNYGHGGYGYQSSWACSRACAQLVHEVLTNYHL